MNIERDVAIDIWRDEGIVHSVEIGIEDFEFLIEKALSHDDAFFGSIIEKLDEIKEREYEQAAKG